MIVIVDYGLGNVGAFLNLYRRQNIPARSAKHEDELRGADKLILPGVGHFDHAVTLLESSGMRGRLEELVQQDKVPILGVCVGMQLLAQTSDEGSRQGLGWIDGRVRSFTEWEPTRLLPSPHMGWNDVTPDVPNSLFAGLEADAEFYFLHSFFFESQRSTDVLASTTYGSNFACAVRCGNVYGVQFHPEKSHRFGMRLLRNFAEL